MAATKWVSKAEAAQLLGKSARTISRWVKDKKLPSKDSPGGVLVGLSQDVLDTAETKPDTAQVVQLRKDNVQLAESVQELTGAVQRLTRELDGTKGDLERVTIQRDNLEVRLQETQEERDQWRGQAAALTQNQRLLAERAGRRFRWPWEPRGEE